MIVLTIYYGFSSVGIDNWGHIGSVCYGFATTVIYITETVKNIDFVSKIYILKAVCSIKRQMGQKRRL